MIKSWEDQSIPLRVVLDGLRQFFSRSSFRSHRSRGAVPLTRCNRAVLAAFELYKTRRVGEKQPKRNQKDKHALIKKEILVFLTTLPKEISSITQDFEAVLEILGSGGGDEEELDRIEDRIDKNLLSFADKDLRIRIKEEVIQEYEKASPQEQDRIFRLKLTRYLREMYRVPHVSPFYY
ncbi:hypothetical protein ACFLT9_08310 [Acidobacteriota bacterium]